MPATYDAALTTARDRMRFLLGDTDTSAPLLDDTTYDTLLSTVGETEGTAQAAEALASRYAQEPDQIGLGGDLQAQWRERVKTWLALAARLRGTAQAAAQAAGWGTRRAHRGDCDAGEYRRPEGWAWFDR